MTTATRLPAQQPEANRLSAYLTGALGTAALLGASQADAAVTSVTFGFGFVLNAGMDTSINEYTAVGAFGTLRFNANGDGIWLGYNADTGPVYNTGLFFEVAGTPTFFTNDVIVGGGTNGLRGTAVFRYFNESPALNLTADQLDKNIGFRTSAGNWGWANVSWNNSAGELTINHAYVESVVGAPITVGDTGAVPEPAASAALLALAGLGVAASCRRPRPLAA